MTTTLTPANAAAELEPFKAHRYGGLSTQPIADMRTGIKLGIYGPGGIGKTTLAGTVCDSPLGGPALYLNARGNPHVIKHRGRDIEVIDIPATKPFQAVEAIRQDILRDAHCPFKTVIVDNVTELWSLDLRDRYGAATVVEWTQHSATTADVLSFLRNYCDLADSGHRLNVVFVMWETPEDRELRGKKVNRSELAFNKALQMQAPGLVTWLGRLYITDEVLMTRCLDFRPIESMQVSKMQVDPKDAITKDIPMEVYNPSLASLIDTIKGGQPWPTARHRPPSLKEISDASVAAQKAR